MSTTSKSDPVIPPSACSASFDQCGSNWYISGAPDPHWSNDALHALGGIKGSDFEVVDTSSLPHPGQ